MGFNDILKSLFGNKSDRDMKELRPIVGTINAEWEKVRNLSNDELRAVRAAGVPIWLVQGVTDSSGATAPCSRRLFGFLTEGASVTETRIAQADPNNSAMTTWETPDGMYKLSLYDTTPDGMLCFAKDYDLDGVTTQVQYSNHWSWIYTLRNNPQDASGTHIVNWAVAQL